MLSIVIVTCNRCKEVLKSICSCDDCATEDYELIIVDNGSVDDTRCKVEAFSRKREINLKYIYLKNNVGGPKGRNIGFKAAEGDVVYFLDDDAWITSLKGSLHQLYYFIKENADIGILTTDIYNVRSDKWQYGAFPINRAKRSEGEVLYYVGASHFVKKNCFDDDILYPPDLFYGEERYVSLRAWGHGKRVYYSPKLSVNHMPSISTRLKEEEKKLRDIVNPYVIKKLLLPLPFRPIIYLLFIIRLFKHYFMQPHLIRKGLRDAKTRYDKYFRKSIGLNTILKLCGNYRLFNFF